MDMTRSVPFGGYVPADDADRRSLRDIRRRESQTSLNEGGNLATTSGGRASVVDDDDSLMFKMSELESSFQPGTSFPSNDASIIFRRSPSEGSYDTQLNVRVDRGLRPVSSSGTMSEPAAAMATVAEDEEKSRSASSTKSEPTNTMIKPLHRADGELHKTKALFFADW